MVGTRPGRAEKSMKICFVSTMSFYPWGGSEILWSQAAGTAWTGGIKSSWSLRIGAASRGFGQAGRRRGGKPRVSAAEPARSAAPRIVQGVARRIFRKRKPGMAPVWRRVMAWGPDVVCISEGTAYEAVRRPDVVQFLEKSGLAYGLVCQHNHEQIGIKEDNAIEQAVAFYRGGRFAAYVADGNRTKAERELANRIPNAIVIKNPVNLTDLSRVAWPSAGPARIASVARLDHLIKGQDLLFEALGGKCWKDRDWRLRLYGSEHSRGFLERLGDMYGLDGRIEFAGHLDDVRAIWADNHLQVLASRSEGTPLSLVESMLCGRPAVVTDVGGTRSG